MNTLIKAIVANRQVTIQDDPVTNLPPVILCSNNDYEVEFSFDHEWEGKDIKTARFVVVHGRETSQTDVVFTGNLCKMPMLCNVDMVYIGVFAGDLISTAKVGLACTRSIMCGGLFTDPPPPDVYNQIIELFENVKGASAFVRFSSNADGSDFTESWREGQNFVGFATSLYAPTKKEQLVWTRVGQGPQGEQGPPGPKGDDGTVSFDELTEEQKEELRGERGPQGPKGDPGVPPYTYSALDLEAGITPLATGSLHFVFA